MRYTCILVRHQAAVADGRSGCSEECETDGQTHNEGVRQLHILRIVSDRAEVEFGLRQVLNVVERIGRAKFRLII